MDQTVLASITAGITLLGSEFTKGVASEAGKATWAKLRSLFGWKGDPPVSELPQQITAKLKDTPSLATEIIQLLRSNGDVGDAATLVGKIDAEKLIFINEIKGDATINM